MSRSRWLSLAVVAVLVTGAIGWWKGRAAQDQPRYRTAAVERGDLSATVSATGSVRPVVQVEIGSQVSGTLSKLYVDYNARVRAGQVLCQIEPSTFRARLLQAEAAVARAEAALKDARRQRDRARELVKQAFISQADVDVAEVAVEQREADVKQAKAQLEAASVDVANTTIRSPIDGVVIARSIDIGQTVAASLQAPKLFVIANDLAQMQVETRIDEADIGRIQAGLPVTFTVDAFAEDTFEGAVSQVRLEPIIESNVVTYTTVIRTRNDGLKLRPGMTANVSILVDKREGVLKVPNAALRFRPPGAPGGGGAPDGMRRGLAALPHVLLPARAEAQPRPAPAGEPIRGPRGDATRRRVDAATGPVEPLSSGPPAFKPGQVWRVVGGKPVAVRVLAGISDGSMTEVRSDELKPGDRLIVGMEAQAARGPQGLQPPPGMGGPTFGRPGGGRR